MLDDGLQSVVASGYAELFGLLHGFEKRIVEERYLTGGGLRRQSVRGRRCCREEDCVERDAQERKQSKPHLMLRRVLPQIRRASRLRLGSNHRTQWGGNTPRIERRRAFRI